MARLSVTPRGHEASQVDQPVESILDQLLRSPPPEMVAKASAKPSTGLPVARPERLAYPLPTSPIDAVRTYHTPKKRADERAKSRIHGSATGKFALAAASPVALASNKAKPRETRTSEDNLILSSATSETYSNASTDSFDTVAKMDENLRSMNALEKPEKKTSSRTYWPKYSADGDCLVVALGPASLPETKLQSVHSSPLHTASTVSHLPSRHRHAGKALPLPITIAAPKGQKGKNINGATQRGQGGLGDSAPLQWSSSASSASEDSVHEVGHTSAVYLLLQRYIFYASSCFLADRFCVCGLGRERLPPQVCPCVNDCMHQQGTENMCIPLFTEHAYGQMVLLQEHLPRLYLAHTAT